MKTISAIALFSFMFAAIPAQGSVITKLPVPAVALTFDACETTTPSYFDHAILNYLLREKLPFTLFVSGKFALRNVEELKTLSHLDTVEIENHSMHHILPMERLPDDIVRVEVLDNARIIEEITGRTPRYFRFPGGNCDDRTVGRVEALQYRVVHWSFASGDPDHRITPDRLTRWVLANTHPGSILIFHINGRGYATGRALPGIVEELKKRGYSLVKLEDALDPVHTAIHTGKPGTTK